MVIGTFGSSFVVSDEPIRDPNKKLVVKGNHGVNNWTIEAFSVAAASSFRWYRRPHSARPRSRGGKSPQ